MSTDVAVNEARARAGQIRSGIKDYLRTLAVIAEAFRLDDWRTLGYVGWDAYLEGEFGEQRLRLPREHRLKALRELRLDDMSNRALAAAIEVDEKTVRRDRASGAANAAPDREVPTVVRGTDGKNYASTRPAGDARPAPQPPREEPGPVDEDEPEAEEPPPVTPVPKVDGRAEVRKRLKDDETAQAHEFLSNFNAALERAGGVYGFDAARLGLLADANVMDSLERHAGLMADFLAEVKRHRGPKLRLVGAS